MRNNKYAIIIITPMTVIALLSAWYLDSVGISFWSNVLLGVFGSGLLSAIIAAISYTTERKRTLENFWSYGHKAINNINKYKLSGSVEQRVDAVLAMNEFDYLPFDDAYGEICFMFSNKRLRRRIYIELYEPILNVRRAISEKTYHFREFKEVNGTGNKEVMETFLSEIDKLLVDSEPICWNMPDGTCKQTGTSRRNKLVRPLLETFNDFYYKLMYPFKKKEDVNNAH